MRIAGMENFVENSENIWWKAKNTVCKTLWKM